MVFTKGNFRNSENHCQRVFLEHLGIAVIMPLQEVKDALKDSGLAYTVKNGMLRVYGDEILELKIRIN